MTRETQEDDVVVNSAIENVTTNLSPSVQHYRIPVQKGRVKCYPAYLFDTVTGKAFGTTYPLPFIPSDGTLTTNTLTTISGYVGLSSFLLPIFSVQALYDPSVNRAYATRTPTKWFNALILNNGSTAIWTSAVGKKARLMGIRITLVNGTTAAAACLLKVLDVAADTGIGVQICGAAMAAVGTSSIIVNETYMNGYLMAATNTAININLSSVLAVAGVHVQVWGTEE